MDDVTPALIQERFSQVLKRFYIAKDITPCCTFCKSTNFTVVIPDSGFYLAAFSFFRKDTSLPVKPVEGFILSCQNCGKIETFARGPFEKWLAETDDEIHNKP